MNSKLVYLLEDDESIRDLVKCALEMNGVKCECFPSVSAFEAAFSSAVPDIAILDIMLGDGNGLDVLKSVKEKTPGVYCIMLSALGKETDKVKGLNLGADDYISKPFGVLELGAKINAVFRRMEKRAATPLTLGNITVNPETMQVTLRGEQIPLSGKEYKLLYYAMENPGRVLSREELLLNVWGYETGETRTIDNYVAHLRKLGIRFETVFGVGYKFIPSVDYES